MTNPHQSLEESMTTPDSQHVSGEMKPYGIEDLPEPPVLTESEDLDLSGSEDLDVPYHKQPVGEGLPTLEELHAAFDKKKRPFPPDEEVIRKWCCALKDPKLLEDPNFTEIREEHLRPFPFLAYTPLPLFEKNGAFHEKLRSFAEKLVERFNCSNTENFCFDCIKEVAAAPGSRYMLDIKVSKGDVVRILRGRICDNQIEDVVDAGCECC